MKEYLSIKSSRRRDVARKIKQTFLKEKNVIFVFIFGSFLNSPSFRDIDIGVYVENLEKDKIFDYELDMSRKIADACSLPYDIIEIKVLNFAPKHFLGNIFSYGKLLFSRNDKQLSEMIENCSLDAIANEYIAYQSLKELLPS